MLNKKYSLPVLIILFLGALITFGCATYYKKNIKFQESVTQGDYEKAREYLKKEKRDQDGINRLLYLFNDGWVDWSLGNYASSNNSFNEADLMIEDQQKKLGFEALALIINPTVKPYQPEDFEVVLIHYFKALNYINLGLHDDALVECRRMNIILYQLNDKYKDKKNRYSDDAFAHVLIGLIYEADNNINDAFIAYRNAYEAYKKVYEKNFNVSAPLQLKKDLLRTAYLLRFTDELRQYEDEFDMQYKNIEHDGGELVFIWQNGFGPVKAEWSINFTVIKGSGGFVTLANEELGLSFPFYIGDMSSNEKASFSDMNFFRVAFPKYVERKPVYTRAKVISGTEEYDLYLAENVNAIAFKTLQDRMFREMANSLLRLATKKAMEQAARQENQDVGAVIGIINALTEKADTRNWQTLPFSISYTRIPLPEGENKLIFQQSNDQASVPLGFDVSIKKGGMHFYTHQSIASLPPSNDDR